VWTDPRASASESNSSRILKAPDIATIRLTRQIDDSEWHIIQDRLDKSIVRGLASSGGLWTALGGILSLLFGSSIMRIMFGQYISSASLLHNTRINTIYISDSKLFSMFGLAHKSTEVRCTDAYGKLRANIEEHIQEDPQNKGLNSLICDHVIDVDPLIAADASNASNAPNVVDNGIPMPVLPRDGPADRRWTD